jgi:hypothetical protein
MEERLYGVTRWLVALTVVFIPLSIFILISGSWGANFGDSQWTRYLLFASWVLLTLSLIAGVSNLINPTDEELEMGSESPMSAKSESDSALEGEEEKEEEESAVARPEKTRDFGYSLLLAQATTFLLGIILYVVFISWMVLPEIPLTGY